MNIICKYSAGLEAFLKGIVDYTIKKYAYDLDIRNLKTIELVHVNDLPYEKDGEACEGGSKIIVSSRLYSKLPSLCINNLLNNSDFKSIVCSLYHEMVHINDYRNMPTLYSSVENMNSTKSIVTGIVWLEYIAEKRTQLLFKSNDSEFCNDFVKRDWKITKFDYVKLTDDNFLFLIKIIPYFLAKTLNNDLRVKYLEKIRNSLLRDFIIELDEELTRLDTLPLFDDPKLLDSLYSIMDRYYILFKRKFRTK